jgi:hypothetical protein
MDSDSAESVRSRKSSNLPALLCSLYSAVFVVAAVFTFTSNLPNHRIGSIGFLLTSIILGGLGGQFRRGRGRYALDLVWLWSLLGLIAGFSAGAIFVMNGEPGWQSAIGLLVAGGLIGSLRWLLSNRVPADDDLEGHD